MFDFIKLPSKVILLWLARKFIYLVGGAAFAGLTVYWSTHGGPDFGLDSMKLGAVATGVGVAVLGDLKRKFLPDLLQVVVGQDPRVDG